MLQINNEGSLIIKVKSTSLWATIKKCILSFLLGTVNFSPVCRFFCFFCSSLPISTLVDVGEKLSMYIGGDPVNLTLFKSLAGSLRYLTWSKPNILYVVGRISRFMENPTTYHFKVVAKMIPDSSKTLLIMEFSILLMEI